MSIVVLVPSRGRPEKAALMYRSAMNTATLPETSVVLLVDADDPDLPTYRDLALRMTVLPERVGYVGALNVVGSKLWDEFTILGAFGDDVSFQTPGWDEIVERTLAMPGIAYGDDLIHGKNHPSAVFMSSVIAKALGWLALPATTHQWADDGWKRLGQMTGCLRYMPDVIVEHLHPAVGKGEWDETYASVFNDERAKGDFEGFTAWAETGLAADAAKVRAVL